MKRAQVLCCLSILTISGCMTLEDVRQTEPLRVETVAGTYRDIATCVAIAWSGHLGNNMDLIIDDKNQEGRIVVLTSETLFLQVNDRKVQVEHRGASAITPIYPAWMWAAVEDCEEQD